MSGQENSLVYADRENGVVPGFRESLQEIVRIHTQCHGPAAFSEQRGIRRPTKRHFFEFQDRASRVAFQKPDWLGEDVSGIAQYSNHLLATE